MSDSQSAKDALPPDYGSMMFQREVLHEAWIEASVNRLKGIFDGVSLEGARVLDLGFGRGNWGLAFENLGAKVTFVEVSAGNIARLRRWTQANRPVEPEILEQDVFRDPLPDGSFDIVWFYGVLQHLPDPEAAVLAVSTLLSKGGHAFIYQYASGSVHEHIWRACKRVHSFSNADLYRRARAATPHGVRWKMDDDFWAPFVHYQSDQRLREQLKAVDLAPIKDCNGQSVREEPGLFTTLEYLCQKGALATSPPTNHSTGIISVDHVCLQLLELVVRCCETKLIDDAVRPYLSCGLYGSYKLSEHEGVVGCLNAIWTFLFATLIEDTFPGFDQNIDEPSIEAWLNQLPFDSLDFRNFLRACTVLRLRRSEPILSHDQEFVNMTGAAAVLQLMRSQPR